MPSRLPQDAAYEAGHDAGTRLAWMQVLHQALYHLGYDPATAVPPPAWILEREAAIAVLQELCLTYGDNDWNPHSPLAEILEEHLAPYLPHAPSVDEP
jgi:hypothetical protein